MSRYRMVVLDLRAAALALTVFLQQGESGLRFHTTRSDPFPALVRSPTPPPDAKPSPG